MLLVVRRLHQNVTVISISQLISRKCSFAVNKVMIKESYYYYYYSALPHLLNAFSTAI